MTTISMDKQYTNRAGHPVRLLCVDGPGIQPVVGIHQGTLETWCGDGSYFDPDYEAMMDLIEAKPRVQCEVWVYRNEFDQTILADYRLKNKGLALRARYTIDVEEGHGLEGGE